MFAIDKQQAQLSPQFSKAVLFAILQLWTQVKVTAASAYVLGPAQDHIKLAVLAVAICTAIVASQNGFLEHPDVQYAVPGMDLKTAVVYLMQALHAMTSNVLLCASVASTQGVTR